VWLCYVLFGSRGWRWNW